METKKMELRKHTSLGGRTIEITGMIYNMGGRKWYSFPYEMDGINTARIKTSNTKKRDDNNNEQKLLNRFLDPKHKDGIKDYIINEPNFTIPAITLVTREDLTFIPHIFGEQPNDDVTIEELIEQNNGAVSGVFKLPVNAKFECLDGNHRTVALKELADEYPRILEGSSVLLNVVYEKEDRKIRQDFVDVNKNAKATSKSIDTLFNTREAVPKIVTDVRESYSYMNEITNVLASSVSKNSNDIYTLNNIKNVIIELSNVDSQKGTYAEKQANAILKSNENLRTTEYKTTLFFDCLKENQLIKQCINNRSDTQEIRQNGIITLGVGIAICASVANEIFNNYDESEHEDKIRELMQYDWSRSNKLFRESGLVSVIDKHTILTSRGTLKATQKLLIEKFINK